MSDVAQIRSVNMSRLASSNPALDWWQAICNDCFRIAEGTGRFQPTRRRFQI